ncbi:MAG: sigma-70 family RNA polymerase sigma factor [Cyanobacteria bacterium P01_F01_bin.150]
MSGDLNIKLKQLIALACASAPQSSERQSHLQELHYLVTTSNRLWKEAVPYYNDAVQDMWVHCFQNLDQYDSDIAGVFTWLDANLKRILRRYRDRQNRDKNRHITTLSIGDDIPLSAVESLPSRPDVIPLLDMWERTLEWVQSDPDGTLKKTYFRNRPDINAQVLILKQFPDKIPWKTIAAEFNLSFSEATDLPKYYSRRCRPLLRAFGKDQGYLDS